MRPRRQKALRQEELGQDRQRESNRQRHGVALGYDNQQDRFRVRSVSQRATYGRDVGWEYVDDCPPIRKQRRRSWSRNSRWQEDDRRAAVPSHGQSRGDFKQDDNAVSTLNGL